MPGVASILITGDEIRLQSQAVGEAPLGRIGRFLFRSSYGKAVPPLTPEVWHAPLDRSDESVRAACREAFARWVDLAGQRRLSKVEVFLGFRHSRLGLVPLGNLRAHAHALRHAAEAWVRERQHLDPTTQNVRWDHIARAKQLVVTCFDKELHRLISDLAGIHRAELVSYRPAVLYGLEQAGRESMHEGPALTLAWLETDRTGERHGAVHLFHFYSGRLAHEWRGWIPASLHDQDDLLEGAIRRFHAAHAITDTRVIVRRWPESVGTQG